MDGVLALDMAAANAAKLDFDGAWAKLLPIITEKSAAEMMIRSIKSSDEAAQRLSRGTGSDVNAPVKASFRPKLPKHF